MTMSATAAAPMAIAGDSNRPTKLFIGGISRGTTTKQLRDHFSQYGRVLDCVAMRTADGHARGFGYVTLDSPTAAERCLWEPQNIDNRIVDMKLAVPEGSGASPTAAAHSKSANYSMGMFGGQADFNMGMFEQSYGNGLTPWWPVDSVSPSNASGLDCMELLCASQQSTPTAYAAATGRSFLQNYTEIAAQDPLDGMGLLLPPVLSSETPGSGQLSANAQEFVPQQAEAGSTKAKSRKNRPVLGELTNILQVQAEDLLKPFKSPTKKNSEGQGHLTIPDELESAPVENEEPRTALGAAPGPSSSKHRFPDLLLDDEEDMEAAEAKAEEKADTKSAGEVSPSLTKSEGQVSPTSSASDEIDEATEGEETVVDMSNLPSIGSAQHATGDCKRCNFFSKGRCANDKDCSFCHFPHDKRKLSRQEKREHRSAFAAQGMDEKTIETLANFMLSPAGSAPPGLSNWQPDAEALSFTPMAQQMHVPAFFDQFMYQQGMPATPNSMAILSTAPSAAASVASTPLPTPVPTPTAAAANSEARTMFSTTPMGVSTTSQKDAIPAPTEEKYQQNMDGHIANQWGRDELLRLRDVLKKMPVVGESAKSTWSIRTAAITASGGVQ